MRIIIFNESPHMNSNASLMIDAFVQEAQKMDIRSMSFQFVKCKSMAA